MKDCILDTCLLLNCLAAGKVHQIIKASRFRWFVPQAVREEAIYIQIRDERGGLVPSLVDLAPLFETELLHLCAPLNEELPLYVELARELDDGEAMALAIARGRALWLGTDDRKASRIARRLGVAVISTPEVVYRWAQTEQASVAEIEVVLHHIEECACFTPRADSPLYEWWIEKTSKGA